MAGSFYWVYYFIFSFYVFVVVVAVVVLLLLNFGQVTRRTFGTFLWCCLEPGGLLIFLVLLFLVIE
jgi:hypothetical protein